MSTLNKNKQKSESKRKSLRKSKKLDSTAAQIRRSLTLESNSDDEGVKYDVLINEGRGHSHMDDGMFYKSYRAMHKVLGQDLSEDSSDDPDDVWMAAMESQAVKERENEENYIPEHEDSVSSDEESLLDTEVDEDFLTDSPQTPPTPDSFYSRRDILKKEKKLLKLNVPKIIISKNFLKKSSIIQGSTSTLHDKSLDEERKRRREKEKQIVAQVEPKRQRKDTKFINNSNGYAFKLGASMPAQLQQSERVKYETNESDLLKHILNLNLMDPQRKIAPPVNIPSRVDNWETYSNLIRKQLINVATVKVEDELLTKQNSSETEYAFLQSTKTFSNFIYAYFFAQSDLNSNNARAKEEMENYYQNDDILLLTSCNEEQAIFLGCFRETAHEEMIDNDLGVYNSHLVIKLVLMLPYNMLQYPLTKNQKYEIRKLFNMQTLIYAYDHIMSLKEHLLEAEILDPSITKIKMKSMRLGNTKDIVQKLHSVHSRLIVIDDPLKIDLKLDVIFEFVHNLLQQKKGVKALIYTPSDSCTERVLDMLYNDNSSLKDSIIYFGQGKKFEQYSMKAREAELKKREIAAKKLQICGQKKTSDRQKDLRKDISELEAQIESFRRKTSKQDLLPDLYTKLEYKRKELMHIQVEVSKLGSQFDDFKKKIRNVDYTKKVLDSYPIVICSSNTIPPKQDARYVLVYDADDLPEYLNLIPLECNPSCEKLILIGDSKKYADINNNLRVKSLLERCKQSGSAFIETELDLN